MADDGRTPPNDDGESAEVHANEPTVRKGYEDAQGPEKQGDGDPGTDPVSEPTQPKRDLPGS